MCDLGFGIRKTLLRKEPLPINEIGLRRLSDAALRLSHLDLAAYETLMKIEVG